MKLEDYQKRIDELEVLIQRFKDEQNRIEDGILAALDRLNQFEAAVSRSLAPRDAADTGPGGNSAHADRPLESTGVPGRARGETGETELNAPAEDESDDDIIFASETEQEAPSEGDNEEDSFSSENPAAAAELDIF
jgi:hypothetical protein